MQQRNYGYIYKITNLKNKKIYIGQKEGEFNPNYFGSGVTISKAVKKYGKCLFKLNILVYAENKDKLNRLEKKYIAQYRKIFGKRHLYNLTWGGDGGDTWSGRHHTKESKEKIRKSHLGKPNNLSFHKLDCKCFICKARRGETKGKNNSMYGRTGKLNPMFDIHRFGIENPNYKHGKYIREK